MKTVNIHEAKTQFSRLFLPQLHRDPFDRILMAQAMREPLRFLTSDKSLSAYSDLVMNV